MDSKDTSMSADEPGYSENTPLVSRQGIQPPPGFVTLGNPTFFNSGFPNFQPVSRQLVTVTLPTFGQQEITALSTTEPRRTNLPARTIEQSLLYQEINPHILFDHDAKVWEFDQEFSKGIPLASTVWFMAGQTWDVQYPYGRRPTYVAAFHSDRSCWNNCFIVTGEGHNLNSIADAALAASWTLDVIDGMIREYTIKFLTHIILCTDSQMFLTAVGQWKWVCRDQIWNLVKKAPGQYTDSPQVVSLLNKLDSLRQGSAPLQVFFQRVPANQMCGAKTMLRERRQLGL